MQNATMNSLFRKKLRTQDVFGISTNILEYSYVDRGELDGELQKYLQRDTHIALKGESKCGKSWMRQRNIPDAITVQCRLNKRSTDLYIDALGQLGIKLTLEETNKSSFKGTIEATQEIGANLLNALNFKLGSRQSGAP